MKILKEYVEAETKFENLAIDLENYLEELQPEITEFFLKVFGKVYGVTEEDIRWGYYTDENYNRVGIYTNEINVSLHIDKIGLNSEFYILPDRLDDPHWISEMIAQEVLSKQKGDAKATQLENETAEKAEEAIKALAKKHGLKVEIK